MNCIVCGKEISDGLGVCGDCLGSAEKERDERGHYRVALAVAHQGETPREMPAKQTESAQGERSIESSHIAIPDARSLNLGHSDAITGLSTFEEFLTHGGEREPLESSVADELRTFVRVEGVNFKRLTGHQHDSLLRFADRVEQEIAEWRNDRRIDRAQLAACEAERNSRVDSDTSAKLRAGMARLPRLEAEIAELKTENERLARREAEKTWRCFHCDETFTDAAEAQEHFGTRRFADTAACQLTAEQVKELRALEATNEQLRCENDDLDNTARLYHEQCAEIDRLTAGHGLFMEFDYRNGEKLVLEEKLKAAEAASLRLREALKGTVAVLKEYVEWFGAVHGQDCPADDTCDCIGGALNKRVNEAIMKAEGLAAVLAIGEKL